MQQNIEWQRLLKTAWDASLLAAWTHIAEIGRHATIEQIFHMLRGSIQLRPTMYAGLRQSVLSERFKAGVVLALL